MARLVEGGCNISIPRKFFPINVHVTYSNHPENVSYMLKTTHNPLATIYQQPQNHVGKCFPVKYHLLWWCFSAMQCCSRDQLKTEGTFKGTVHFEIHFWYVLAYLKCVQDVGFFVSTVFSILTFFSQTVVVYQSYNAGMGVHVKEHAQRSQN